VINSGIFRGAAGRRRRAAWAAVPEKAIRPALMGTGMFLMAGAGPLGAAFFAAGLFAGENPIALLAGCGLGAIAGGNLALPLGCALILGGFLLADALPG